jgi:hypothetical protein
MGVSTLRLSPGELPGTACEIFATLAHRRLKHVYTDRHNLAASKCINMHQAAGTARELFAPSIAAATHGPAADKSVAIFRRVSK